ncbi:MAG: hypothetical protein NT154_20505 [Verrucomicrobia bacterium]|nr:hypothetical protein [Verrucomicrobiota bacterium]
MKLVQATKTRLVFHLGQREKRSLVQMLKLYPRVPSSHHVLSKSGRLPSAEANQQLLDEALAEQRADNKKQLQALLADPKRFADTETGGRLSLTRVQVEWLLQVLNDIRVGSWVILGSPEKAPKELTPANAPHFLAMEMAGHLQMQLLEARERET